MSTINLEGSRTPNEVGPKSVEFWTQFEGQLLDGQFKLNKYTGQDGGCAVFMTELPGQDLFVAAKIIRAASLQAEQLTASWRSAKDLKHPNLVRVFATGAADLDGLRVVYSVLEYPDATLAQVIQQRCLDEEEARDVLVNCAEALQYLHQKGLVHTSLRPATIIAVDKATKISTDYVCSSSECGPPSGAPDAHDAPDVQKTGYTSASDIWSLGVSLFEALKHRIPMGSADPEVLSMKGPLGEIIRRCLEPKPASRWSAAKILSFVKSPYPISAEPAPKPQPSVPMPPASKESSAVVFQPKSKQDSKGLRNSVASPSVPSVSALPRKREVLAIPEVVAAKDPPTQQRRPWRKIPLRYAFSAVVVLICIGWLAKTSVQTDKPVISTLAPDPPPAVHQTPVQPKPAPPLQSPPDRPSPFEFHGKTKPAAPPAHAAPASGSADRGRPLWRVVVYTYSTAQAARAKAANLNKQSPQLHAEVLSLGGGSSHMVVLGGKMQRDQASKLRGKLLAEGFPRDTYIQNFPE